MALTAYRRKRDFRVTPEPRGGKSPRASTGAYLIHEHDATRLHYDLRLELDGVLKSWAVPKGPSLDPSVKRLAVEVEDHPREYGKFEGVIPKGEYGAGAVLIWDRGRWSAHGDPRAGLAKGHLEFELHGEKLSGGWKLVRMGGRAQQDDKVQWLLIKNRDAAARTGAAAEIVTSAPGSVASGRKLDDLNGGTRGKSRAAARTKTRAKRADSHASANGNGVAPKPARAAPRASRAKAKLAAVAGARAAALPDFVPPMLATLVASAPDGEEWLHEPKYDGYRMQCRVDRGKVTLLTRSGKDWTKRFGTIAAAAAEIGAERALLDGEIVALRPDGTTSFQTLQNHLGEGDDSGLSYFVFDLLHLDGRDLSAVPLEARKELLERLLGQPAPDSILRYSDHVLGQGGQFHREACRLHLEGIISKRRDGHYTSRRSRDWLKTKCLGRQEFVIGGYTRPQGSRTSFGALLLGVRDDSGGLRYSGRVGTGFDAQSLRDLQRQLEPLQVEKPPFENPPASRDVQWVKPRLVAEVSFTEWTADGRLRHPSFQGLRTDKPARDVRREDAAAPEPAASNGRPKRAPARAAPAAKAPRERATTEVVLTHPDKVLFPEAKVTKQDLAHYFETISARMLPEVVGRPLMLMRCPDGRTKPCFMQKHVTGPVPRGLGSVEIQGSEDREPYLFVRDATGLAALVQMGVVELHVWGARAEDLERPDRMVFDLDPDPKTSWADVVRTTLEVRKRLEALGLESFLKTTGGKGLHVVVPLRPGAGWEEIQQCSAAIARDLVREEPTRLTTHLSKAKRAGRLFLDTLRNRRGATWVAPYSPRAREGAPVSMPIDWKELGGSMRSDHFTVRQLLDPKWRAGRDPWKELPAVRQTITAGMLRKLEPRGR